jgi:hypothetical protein
MTFLDHLFAMAGRRMLRQESQNVKMMKRVGLGWRMRLHPFASRAMRTPLQTADQISRILLDQGN